MKKTTTIVFSIFLLLMAAAVIWWKSPSSKSIKQAALKKITPEIKIASMNITDIDANKIKMISKVVIKIPCQQI